MRRTLTLAAAPSLFLGACLATGQPAPVRYFSGEAATPTGARVAPGAERLRVRDVRAAGHLKERMARRLSDVEVEFRELERWTEPPLAYLERALLEELFERGGLRRSEARDAPALDVALVAFDEVAGPGPSVHVAFALRLTGADGDSLYDRTVERRLPLDEPGAAGVAHSLSLALRHAAAQAAEEIAGVLAAR